MTDQSAQLFLQVASVALYAELILLSRREPGMGAGSWEHVLCWT
jgi:hypothetical protein